MSDEHDPAVTGCYGDRVVQTPHLDRLAADGITFDGCYTNSPLCVPARLSFTAGKYVSRCGAWNNDCWLPSADYPSLPRVLSAAGYDPHLCGKMHYDRDRRYGFNDLLPGLHSNGDPKKGTLERRDPDSTAINSKTWEDRIKKFFVGDEEKSPHIMKHDVRCTTGAIDFLSKQERGGKPFFLTVGYLAPHFPLIVPQQYYDAVKGRVPMPELPPDWFEHLPANYKHLIRGFGIPNNVPDLVRLGRELYWALTGWLDNEIGKVLRTLEQSAVGRDTIVIYTSDHGENKGDHGLWWKNNMYDHAARIPLIARWPERWEGGQRRAGACSLVDLVQTIAEIAGGETPSDWDGDSMLKWMDNPSTKWKDLAVSEYYGHNVASGFAMLRQGAFKYVYHTRAGETQPAERELYNLAEDPGEWNNLASNPAHQARVRAMHAALVKELGRDPEEAEQECRESCAKGYANERVTAAV
jgi:choline-sulfatase